MLDLDKDYQKPGLLLQKQKLLGAPNQVPWYFFLNV